MAMTNTQNGIKFANTQDFHTILLRPLPAVLKAVATVKFRRFRLMPAIRVVLGHSHESMLVPLLFLLLFIFNLLLARIYTCCQLTRLVLCCSVRREMRW
jgi:hypothetical protein